MSISIKSGSSTAVTNVDIYSAVTINTPTTKSQTGYFVGVGEIDDGTILGTKTHRKLNVTQDYRLNTGIDKISWHANYGHSILSASRYLATALTQTISIENGTLNLNANNTLDSGAFSIVRTAKTFSLFNSFPLYADFQIKTTGNIQSNSIIEFGFGLITGSTSPFDGIFFRITNGVSGVIVNNTLETSSSNVFTPTSGGTNHYLIVAGIDKAEFWINDVLTTIVYPPSTTGGTTNSNSFPLFFRSYNASLLAAATQLNVYQAAVSIGDMDSGKDWATTMVINGQSSISAPDGQTTGSTSAQTSNNINSSGSDTNLLIPGVDFTNTYTSGVTLGGQFAFSGCTSGETDYILFAYKNPPSTASIPGKNLLITGVEINSFVSGATTIGLTLFQWGLGIGGTDVTLTTADSVTSGTRASRRINLGTQSVATGQANGAPFNKDLYTEFPSPLMVEPGTYCHVILKIPVIAPVLLGNYRGTVMINGYYE